MRVRWIGDARVVQGIGPCSAGMELDLEGDMLVSLMEQGKVEKIGMTQAKADVVSIKGNKLFNRGGE